MSGIDIISDSTGKAIVDRLDKQNALLQVMASEGLTTFIQKWSDIQKVIRDGIGSKLFSVNDYFLDTWTDTAASVPYEVPWGVRHFLNAELQDGEVVPGMAIQWNYCSPFGVQFSHQRAFLKCPEGLSAGTYYFTFESSWGDKGYVVANDVVCFTTANGVPVGGRISGCYGAPDQPKSSWRIYIYDADGKTILETLTPVFTISDDNNVNLGIMKLSARNGNLNSIQEMAYGWNRWKTSALRQFLNSAAGANQWWMAQDEWDIAPDQLATKAGFLSGLSEDLLGVLKPVKVVTYTNTVQDGGDADITYDKIFLPSIQEMHIAPQVSGEGEVWDYWRRASEQSTPLAQYGTYPQMITYDIGNKTSPQFVSTRSAYRGSANRRWIVNASGLVDGGGTAGGAIRFAPTCVIA